MSLDLISMYRSMGGLAQDVVLVLLLMLALSIGISIGRIVRYRAARTQSRAFVQQSADAFREGKIEEAIFIAGRNTKSHIANLTATGLGDFLRVSLSLSEKEVIETVKRGLDHSAMTIHAEMKRGLTVLATIGATAPFVGLFGTVVGIIDAFAGRVGQKEAVLAMTARGISEALVTTAFGMFVAVPAVWCYNYFVSQIESFDVEMTNSSLELVSYLVIHSGQRKQCQRG